MRLKATIVVVFKSFIIEWKQLILIYAIIPLILAAAMGYFQKDLFKPQTTIDKIDINIVDNDNSKASESFKEIFQSEELKKLFNVSDKGSYIITIPKGYEENVTNLKDTSIRIEEKNDDSHENEIIIKTIINEYGKGLTESGIIFNKITGLNAEDKERLFNQVTSSINQLYSTKVLENDMLKGKRTLTSYENQAASIITYLFFMIIMSCTASFYKDKENGSFKRLISTPITRETFFYLDLVIFFISSFAAGVIYIAAFAAAGFGFRESNPFILILILIGQSLLITSISGLLIAFLNKTVTNIVIMFFMYIQILFGGVFIPIKGISSQVFANICKFAPANVISSSYKNCILFNSISKVSNYLIIMLLISAVLSIISIIKVKTRWEE